jgi:hypothetical protein
MAADVPCLRQVQDFEEELEDTQAARTLGSQNSNKRTSFPKVRAILPDYLQIESSDVDSSCSDDGSYGSEWLGPLHAEDSDDVDKVEDDFHGEFDKDSLPEEWDDTVEDWCTKSRFFEREFRARKFKNTEAFLQYYSERVWSSDHVRLLGNRDTFCGPTPGYIAQHVLGRATTPSDF